MSEKEKIEAAGIWIATGILFVAFIAGELLK